MLADDVLKDIRAYALKNAVKFDGKASGGAVMGKVLGKHPELRDKAADVGRAMGKILKEVNAMSVEDQLADLQELAPELLEKKKKEEKRGLPDLPNAEEGKVVTRIPPDRDRRPSSASRLLRPYGLAGPGAPSGPRAARLLMKTNRRAPAVAPRRVAKRPARTGHPAASAHSYHPGQLEGSLNHGLPSGRLRSFPEPALPALSAAEGEPIRSVPDDTWDDAPSFQSIDVISVGRMVCVASVRATRHDGRRSAVRCRVGVVQHAL